MDVVLSPGVAKSHFEVIRGATSSWIHYESISRSGLKKEESWRSERIPARTAVCVADQIRKNGKKPVAEREKAHDKLPRQSVNVGAQA